MIKQSFLWVLSLCFSCLFSEIHEIRSLKEADAYIQPSSLVLCELDHILVKGQNIASSLRFYDHLQNELLAEGCSIDEAINKLYPVRLDIIKHSPHQVSERVPSFIEAVTQKKCPVLGFTHRGPELAYETLDLCKKYHLLFPHFNFENIFKDEDPFIAYYDGVCFIHPICSKAEVLASFVKKAELECPIVCIDYSFSKLAQMQTEVEKLGLPFVGLCLAYESVPLTEKEIKQGHLQLQYLGKILSDTSAQLLLKSEGNEN